MTKSQQAIRDLVKTTRDTSRNLPPLPGIFPDAMSPVVFTASDGERELTMMRWGMPAPPQYGSVPVTNIRDTGNPYWRRWLGPEDLSAAARRRSWTMIWRCSA
jgi:putative SOS response-associated peptidase YedK